MSTRAVLPERLSSKFVIDPNGCWVWTAGLRNGGYGRYRHDGWEQQAHRVTYELLVGPIPKGLDLDHLCRVRHCVNPDHLEPVTRQENLRRGETGIISGLQQRSKTECPRKHPYNDENTYLYSDGRRACYICKRASSRDRYLQRRKSA